MRARSLRAGSIFKQELTLSKLVTFLEDFDPHNRIKICDANGRQIFDGVMGEVPQSTANQMNVIRHTAIFKNGYLEVKVRK